MAEVFSNQAQTPLDGGMSCQQAERQIERLILDADLKDAERALLMAHVRGCAACKRALENFRKLEVRLKESFATLDTAPNFNERLMAALPSPASSDSPAWARTRRPVDSPAAASVRESVRMLVSPRKRSLLRAYWIGWAMVGLVAIGLLGAWFHHGFGRGSEGDSLPLVSDVRGNAVHLRGDGNRYVLTKNALLRSKDEVISQNEIVDLQLTSGPNPIGNIVLAPHAKLAAINRHHFQLNSGKAYFHVRKDRPKASEQEHFDIDVPNGVTVRVTGTSFCVDTAAAAQGGALVVVEEGTVEVWHGNNVSNVTGGQEIDITKGSAPRPSNVKDALAWMNPSGPIAAKNSIVAPVPSAPAAKPIITAPRQTMSWDRSLAGVFFAGKSLPEGIEVLADALGKPQQLMDLLDGTRGPLVSQDCRLSFSVYNQMPLRSVVSWMARDVGGCIEFSDDGSAHFRLLASTKPIGAPSAGAMPEEVRKSLEAKIEDNLAGIDSIVKLVDLLSQRCGYPIIVDRPLRERFSSLARTPDFALNGQTVMQKLEALLAILRCGCAWYDNAIYVASPSRIETLTTIDRACAPMAQLVGQPINPNWAQTLREILAQQLYPAEHLSVQSNHGASHVYSDSVLAGKPAFSDLTLDLNRVEGPQLRYRSGLFGEAIMNSMLNTIAHDSPPAPSVVGLLSPRQMERGPVASIQTLIQQARDVFPAVDCRIKAQPFSNQAFVNKSLQLGEALEWAAWLSGAGVRQENNVLIIDDAFACYGSPSLRVISVEHLVQRRPELAQDLPQKIVQLLPQLYPTFFANVELRTLGGRVIFVGDLRQLQLAQRVRNALELAIEASGKNSFDLAVWLPQWRTNIDKNLAEPFKFVDAKLSSTFAGVLRQSALASQLRCTVIVDSTLMREHHADNVEIDAVNQTLRQVLDNLAKKIGAKLTVEGEIVWIKP